MRISDNTLREYLIQRIELKGEQSQTELVSFAQTWVSPSKTREVLISLVEEGILSSYKVGINKSSPVKYDLTIEGCKQVIPTPASAPVVIPELSETLKHEFEIILRKQKKRRDYAAKVLQNAEATIRHLEGLL